MGLPAGDQFWHRSTLACRAVVCRRDRGGLQT
jgi:hypothetical protein